MESCPVCQRIEQIQRGENTHFVTELETGYVVLGDIQWVRGYTVFIAKEHKTELHELERGHRMKFLEEMALVAEAVFRAFHPQKMNYELLGNTDAHMHWHLWPRYTQDLVGGGPMWVKIREIQDKDAFRPTAEDLVVLKRDVLNQLNVLKSLHS